MRYLIYRVRNGVEEFVGEEPNIHAAKSMAWAASVEEKGIPVKIVREEIETVEVWLNGRPQHVI